MTWNHQGQDFDLIGQLLSFGAVETVLVCKLFPRVPEQMIQNATRQIVGGPVLTGRPSNSLNLRRLSDRLYSSMFTTLYYRAKKSAAQHFSPIHVEPVSIIEAYRLFVGIHGERVKDPDNFPIRRAVASAIYLNEQKGTFSEQPCGKCKNLVISRGPLAMAKCPVCQTLQERALRVDLLSREVG